MFRHVISFVTGVTLLTASPAMAGASGGAIVVRWQSGLEETFAFENAETGRLLVLSYGGFGCDLEGYTFHGPTVQHVTTPAGDTHQLIVHSPMHARVYGPATIEEFLAAPCAFLDENDHRMIAEGEVHIHSPDSEFLGPLVFAPGPGPGARVIVANWNGRLTDLVNGGSTHLRLRIHLVFGDDQLRVVKFDGPHLTPDPLGTTMAK